jgi:hypothetical protein
MQERSNPEIRVRLFFFLLPFFLVEEFWNSSAFRLDGGGITRDRDYGGEFVIEIATAPLIGRTIIR